jgi:hypothetical protein
MDDVNSYTGSAAGSAAEVTIQAVLCWSEFYNGKWQDMKTSDVDDPAILQIPATAMDRNLELDRNRIRIVVQPYLEYVPSDALVLAILPPSDGSVPVIPFGAGFVMHNTHSLPTNSANVVVDFGQFLGALAAVPIPLRTLTQSKRYLGDLTSGTFSVARYNSLQGIHSPKVDATLAVLRFPARRAMSSRRSDRATRPTGRSSKTSAISSTSDSDILRSQLLAGSAPSPPQRRPSRNSVYSPDDDTVPVGSGPDPALVDPTVNQGPGAALTYAGAGRNLVAGFASQATFSFQGRVIGIAGGTPGVSRATTIQNKGG